MPRKLKSHSSRLLLLWLWLPCILFALIVLIANIKYTQNLIGEALGEKANLVAQADQIIGTVRPVWEGVAQGGEGDQSFPPALVDQTADIRLRLVRLDHVFDQYNLVTRTPSGLIYDFSKLDPIVDTIVTMGAKPFFSLSYMPPALSRSGQVTDLPTNWNEWQQLVRRFILHYSGTRERNLANIYYEVWNEPDHFGQWKLTGDKSYLDLYRYSARGALQATPAQSFSLGGPATTSYYPNWIQGLSRLAVNEHLPLNFLSWHRYSLNSDDFRRDLESVSQWRQQNSLPALPLIISEWGFDPEVNPGYDTPLAAAHMVSVISQTASLSQEMLAFELIDGPDPAGKQLWGRWGMLTSQKFGIVKKPRYRALQLLQGLGDQQLSVSGQGTWVKALFTWTNRGLIGVITNYDPRGHHWEDAPLTINHLGDSNYQVTIRRLNGLAETKVINPLNGQWQTHLVLQTNDVVRMQLTPLPREN